MCNKNVDIKFSVHDTFLEYPSSGTLKAKILENQIILNSFITMVPSSDSTNVPASLFTTTVPFVLEPENKRNQNYIILCRNFLEL
jgi:hypothetical protein